jgi:23S rRNA (cytidine1920-2'-O)/16S rRNA (cytidine1409-2'-O)-methyltransferase
MRLDQYVHQYHNIQSRNKASELIKAKQILVDGNIITKPSFEVNENSVIQILQGEQFVSRSAEKLNQFLLEFPVEMKNKDTLDIGSSTGGFTQILLKNDVKSVTCVDVGNNQLHPTLRDNPKLTIKENTDIRDFISEPFDVITCDVSFISILTILKDIDRLAQKEIIILYKPQFEVGRGIKRNSSGVVQDIKAIEKVSLEFEKRCSSLGWRFMQKSNSKVAGKEGNIEILYHFQKEKMC